MPRARGIRLTPRITRRGPANVELLSKVLAGSRDAQLGPYDVVESTTCSSTDDASWRPPQVLWYRVALAVFWAWNCFVSVRLHLTCPRVLVSIIRARSEINTRLRAGRIYPPPAITNF